MSNDPLTVEVGARVRRLRRKQRRTLQDVGKVAIVHPIHLLEVEKGRTSPSIKTLDRIAGGLDMKSADLLNVGSLHGKVYELLRKHPSLVSYVRDELARR